MNNTVTVVIWQPIDTAPENIKLLLYCPELCESNPERIEIGFASRGSYYMGGQKCPGTWSEHAWATHWAYLPVFPAKTSLP
jgi:hypothetical protein